jgi:beta-mannosidase
VRSQAITQARRLVELLGHHPSVVVWCGHDAPDPVDRTRPAPRLLEQQKPNWTRTVLDRSVRRTLDRADPSRPVISHSGVLPNLPRLDDADSHLWFGWHGGHAADLESYIARLPRAGRFVSAFGAQSVPDGLDVAAPGGWPTVDWERLARELDADTDVLARRFPPGHYADADAWSAATRRHQAHILRIQIETLRRRKYRPTGGFAIDRLLDGAPAISGSLLDHRRTPKVAYRVVAAACAETIVVASPPPLTLVPRSVLRCEVCVIHDGRRALEDVRVTAALTIAGETLTWTWEGRVEADAVTRVGLVEWPLGSARGEVRLDLGLVATDATSENGYTTRIGA